MATKNAIGSGDPIEVAAGGTGNSTLTDGGVLVGSGVGAVTSLSVGATGTLLTGITASDPIFATSSNGDFTFTSSSAGSTRTLKSENTDNTNSSSSGRVDISVGGSSAGDPKINYIISGQQTWSTGIDNSDSDKFKISASAALETATALSCTTAGEITMPLQPAFNAACATQSNVTGDATVYTVTFTTAEYFDQNNDFDGTSTFTAPVTGKYQFNCQLNMDDLTTSHTSGTITLSTSNRDYLTGYINSGAIKSSGDNSDLGFTFLVDMDSADTAIVKITISNGTKVVDVVSGWFNGFLAC